MSGVEAKNLGKPDEVRTPPKTNIEVVHLGDTEVGRFTMQPGWKWSECIKPVVNTDSCQAEHLGYAVSGQLRIVHNDGSQLDISPGDAYLIAPGHDASVVGNEPFVGVEFKSAATYAKS